MNDYDRGSPVDPPPPPTPRTFSIIAKPSSQQVSSQEFDCIKFFECLKTSSLGHTLLYTPVVTSTQTLFSGNVTLTGLLDHRRHGVVFVAGQQTMGKGTYMYSTMYSLDALGNS